MGMFRALVSWLAWPGLLAVCVVTTEKGFALKQPQIGFYLTYVALAATLLLLERWMPHEAEWSPPDGQLANDLGHTLLSTTAVQGALVFSSMVGVSLGFATLSGAQYGIWPRTWPMWLQVSFGLAVLEFTLYWAHRLAHEWQRLWYFHAIHHSVSKLWAINNGRFHFVDALKSVLPGIVLLLVLGAPMDVLTWLSALGAYIGMLTHCNVRMRFGPLSAVFNTPELHRWHHSRDTREGNKNYGESLMLWDWVFGTWFNAHQRPPANIGIAEVMPLRFWGQVMWPFQRLRGRGDGDSSKEALLF